MYIILFFVNSLRGCLIFVCAAVVTRIISIFLCYWYCDCLMFLCFC